VFSWTSANAQITPSTDAYADTAAPTKNYGAVTMPFVDSATDTTYIQFDLASILSGGLFRQLNDLRFERSSRRCTVYLCGATTAAAIGPAAARAARRCAMRCCRCCYCFSILWYFSVTSVRRTFS
jgi:hypothetical protein